MSDPAPIPRLRWLRRLRPFRQGLSLRTAIVLAVAVGLIVPTLIAVERERGAAEQQAFAALRVDLEQMADILSAAMRDPLWQVSPDLGRPLMQAMFRDERLVSVTVRDAASPEPFLDLYRSVSITAPSFSVTRNVVYEGRIIGSVEVSVSAGPGLRRVDEATRQFLWRAAASVLVSLGLIYVVLQFLLVRPIQYLTRMSAGLSRRYLSEPIRLRRRDELGRLAGSLEETRRSLAQLFTQLEAKNRELEAYAGSLEARVEVRTRELSASNAKLSQAVETLQQAQRELVETERLASLGRLVAGVAHELNTPLGTSLTVMTALDDRFRELTVAVAAGSLRRSELDAFLAGGRQGFALLQRNIERAAKMVGDFRQVAVDQTSEQRRVFDLKEVIEEVLVTLSPRFRKTPFALHVELAEGLRLDSYPGPFGQVLTNLVLNALAHAFEGCENGNVWVQSERLAGNLVRVSVADDGVGMPAKVRERIFDPFFTTKLGQGGSGLGLNIAHSIVTGLLGGRIAVTSNPGEGARFVVELPVCAPTPSEAEKAAALAQ